MASMSKLINSQLGSSPCSEIIHRGLTCRQSITRDFFGFFVSNARYFLPIIGIPVLMKIRNMNWEMAIDAWQYFLEVTLSGHATGWTVSSSICLFRALIGRFHPLTTIIAPCAIAGSISFFVPARVAQLYATAIFQVSLEAFIRQRRNFITRTITDSKFIAQTLLFMTCSATIMTQMQKYKMTPFWFVRPSPKADIGHDGKAVCGHGASCVKHCFDGIKSHFIVGLSLELLKILFNKVPTQSGGFFKTVIQKFKTMKFGTLNFLLSYMAIYRISSCLLTNFSNTKNPENLHILASFLGGASYLACPKMTLLAYGMTVCITLLWQRQKSDKSKQGKLIEELKKLPFDRMFIPIGLPYIVSLYIFRRSVISTLGSSLINGVTNNKAMHIWEFIQPKINFQQ